MSDDPRKEPPRGTLRPTTEADDGPLTEVVPLQSIRETEANTAPTEKRIAVPSLAPADRATLSILVGLEAGKVFPVDGDQTTLGRDPRATIFLDDAAISRHHALITRQDNAYVLEDTSSTNGTFLRGQRVHRAALKSGDRVQLGPNVVLRFALTDEAEESLLRRLYDSATRDALTDVFNRKHFTERLASEIAFARRHHTDIAVLVLDVDHFKQVNDAHGHLIGDEVLRALARTIAGVIRREDLFARYGGEEFVILARSSTPVDVRTLAERLRSAVAALTVPAADATIRITISIGVASLAECGDEAPDSELLALADERLFKAKHSGRNRICGA
jgi:diguanylate cyclase (GGDEF)-like protein